MTCPFIADHETASLADGGFDHDDRIAATLCQLGHVGRGGAAGQEDAAITMRFFGGLARAAINAQQALGGNL